MPGETGFLVLDANGKPLESQTSLSDPDEVIKTVPPPGGRTRGSRSSWPATRRRPAKGRRPRSTCDRPVISRIDPADEAAIAAQLGREPRAIHDVGHRCPCGNPDVVTTEPRLPNGTPFPTTFYLTCPRAASRIGTLEGSGLMKEMQDRLSEDPELAAAYARAHEAYLGFRGSLAAESGHDVPEIDGHLRRWHARPGQVPARARRPVAGHGARRQPAGRRGARPAGGLVGVRSLRCALASFLTLAVPGPIAEEFIYGK